MEHTKKYEYMQPMTHPEIPDQSCYDLLAAAVVKSAAEEYMLAYRKRYKGSMAPTSDRAKSLDRVLREDEKFFRSQRFDIFVKSNVNPEALIERLQYLALNTNRTTFGHVN